MAIKSGTYKKRAANAKHTIAKSTNSGKTYFVVCIENKGAEWFCEEETLNVHLKTVTDLYTIKEYRTFKMALKKCSEFNALCNIPSAGHAKSNTASVSSSNTSLLSWDEGKTLSSVAKTGDSKSEGPLAEVSIASAAIAASKDDLDDCTATSSSVNIKFNDDPFAEDAVHDPVEKVKSPVAKPFSKETETKSKCWSCLVILVLVTVLLSISFMIFSLQPRLLL